VLDRVGSVIQIEDNTLLETTSAPALTTVGSSLIFRNNPELYLLDLSAISCVPDFTIETHSLSADDYISLAECLHRRLLITGL
jgi:hypothetical protein